VALAPQSSRQFDVNMTTFREPFGIQEVDVEEDASLGSIDVDVVEVPSTQGHGDLDFSLLRSDLFSSSNVHAEPGTTSAARRSLGRSQHTLEESLRSFTSSGLQSSSASSGSGARPLPGSSQPVFAESLLSFTSAHTFASSRGGGAQRAVTVENLTFVTDAEMETIVRGDDFTTGRTKSTATLPLSATLGTGAFSTVRLAWRNTPGHARENGVTMSGDGTKTECARADLPQVHSHGIGTSRGTPQDKGELVAVKIMHKSILKQMKTLHKNQGDHLTVSTAFDNIEQEIATMKRLRHVNLVRLLDVIDSVNNDRLYMVLEYVSLGEILSHVEGTNRYKRMCDGRRVRGLTEDRHYDEEHAALYFVDVMNGLAYLHWHRICHRDLKPENILLCTSGIAKISDFGAAHTFKDENQLDESLDISFSIRDMLADFDGQVETKHNDRTSLTQCNRGMLKKADGTWCFWSPEMCSHKSEGFSGYSSDLWAAGICLYIFTTGLLPFFSLNPVDLFDGIAKDNIQYQGLGLSCELQDLLEQMLHKDPSSRPVLGDCLKHTFCANARAQRIRMRLGDHDEHIIPSQKNVYTALSATVPSNRGPRRNITTLNSAPSAPSVPSHQDVHRKMTKCKSASSAFATTLKKDRSLNIRRKSETIWNNLKNFRSRINSKE